MLESLRQPAEVWPLIRKLESARAERGAITVVQLEMGDRVHSDRYVRRHPNGTPFHLSAWLESVAESFSHRPHHLLAKTGNRIVGLLPLFHVRSRLGGSMLVSVPYAVGGGILADSTETRIALWQMARRIADETGSATIEMRGDCTELPGCRPIAGYAGFSRELPTSARDVLSWLPRKARAAARNAHRKHGLVADFNCIHLPAVWVLYCRSMRRLGSLCYPRRFFAGLVERFGRDAFVQIVRNEDRVIAGLISFRFGSTFLPYFVGCDERFYRCNANNYLYLTAMERAVEEGCRLFDFGRTRANNKGSYDFKRFHGFEPTPLSYGRWVARGSEASDLTPSNPKFQLARRIWKHLPLPLSVYAGTRVARHVPG